MYSSIIENLIIGMKLELANEFVVQGQDIIISLSDGTQAKIEIINL